MSKNCLACDLISGKTDLPGGRIYRTKHWVVEHCIGPLNVGTLIVKPFRHCIHFWELNPDEVQELGLLLHKVSNVIKTILKPDQIYMCLWSHAGWTPGHIHFVLQPSWDNLQKTHKRPGPFLQVEMFETDKKPDRGKIESFVKKAKEILYKS